MASPKNLDVLVMNAKQMNQDALEELYDTYLPHVYRYIYYQVNDRSIAEDLTSETFLKMLSAIAGFREDGRSFYPWLLRIAKNATLDYIRSKYRQSQVPFDEDIEELVFDSRNQVELEYVVMAALDGEVVRKAVSKLTEDQQQVLLLKFTMGLSNAEIGKVLGKTEGSIKSLQVRALASLKRLIDMQGNTEERIEPTIGMDEIGPVIKA